MIELLAQQVLAILGLAAILGLPGWAASRLLELHLRLPAALVPVAWVTLGLAVWTVELVPALAVEASIRELLAVHGAVAAALVAAARVRERRRGHAKLGGAGISGWTLVVILLCLVAALAIRTRMAFDSLFHLGLARRMLELDALAFDTLDRVAGAGVNPAYAVPSWQAAIAATSSLTGLDPATVLEAAAVVAVVLGACAAAGLGRLVQGGVAGELAGAAAFAWMRVFFARRELEGDGIAYAALPGNVALDVLLPACLACALVLLQDPRGLRRALPIAVLGAAATALLVVLHANYVVYLAVIAAGTVLWLLAAGPWSRDVARRLGAAFLVLAVPGLACLALLLPVLASLDHFGAPRAARIDYHLVELAGAQLVRPGHLYDGFGVAGLLAVLLLPWGAWRARGVSRALIGGGALALLAVALVPPLVSLLAASGSLTLSLRLPRPFGVLLVAALAVALPDLVARTASLAARAGAGRGPWAPWLVRLAPLAIVLGASASYGYPLARQEPPDYGWDWPTLFALALLVLVLAGAVRARVAGAPRHVRRDRPMLPQRTLALALVMVAVCMLPSGLMSMRRAAWQARELVAATRADDLRCFDGVERALRRLPAGSVLLTDPVTAYGAQALAPLWVAADFKVWNGSTDSARITRRIALLRATFGSASPERAGAGLARLSIDLDARYLLVSGGPVEPPLGSTLGTFDAAGLRALLASGAIDARRVAAGGGRFPDGAEEADRDACDLALWRLDGSERALELQRDEHHRDGHHR